MKNRLIPALLGTLLAGVGSTKNDAHKINTIQRNPNRFARRAKGRHGLAIAAATMGVLFLPAANAVATTIEHGPGWRSVAQDGGRDGDTATAKVVVRLNSRVTSYSGQLGVQTTLLAVQPQPGVTYQIKKDGGFDAPVVVELQRGECSANFKALYRMSKTVIDSGRMVCR